MDEERIPLVAVKTASDGRESCVKQRYVLAAITAVGFALAYCVRISLSVALVAMVNSTYVSEHNSKKTMPNDTCPNLERANGTTVYEEGEFEWSPYIQGIISGSFFYGYLLTQLLGGYLSDKYGPKHVLGLSIFISSLLSLATPFTARLSLYLFIFLRIVEGFFQGVIYPAISSMMAAWAPVKERGVMFMSPNIGIYIGIVVAFPVSGYLCQHGFAGGWPSAFYVFGVAGCLWYPAWLYFTSNSPQSHPRISQSERVYIMKSKPQTREIKMPIPWRKILTSVRVFALLIAYAGGAFGYQALLAFLPTYMNEILKFDIVSDSAVSIIPYVAAAIGTVISGYAGDFLSIKLHNVTLSRKIITFIALVVSGVLVAVIPAVGCNRLAVIILLTSYSFLCSLNTAGYILCSIDLAPQFAGVVMGLANTAGTVGLILGPYAIGVIINDAQTQAAWATAFYVIAAVSISSGLFFLVFGSGELQSWAMMDDDDIVVNCNSDSASADAILSTSGINT